MCIFCMCLKTQDTQRDDTDSTKGEKVSKIDQAKTSDELKSLRADLEVVATERNRLQKQTQVLSKGTLFVKSASLSVFLSSGFFAVYMGKYTKSAQSVLIFMLVDDCVIAKKSLFKLLS